MSWLRPCFATITRGAWLKNNSSASFLPAKKSCRLGWWLPIFALVCLSGSNALAVHAQAAELEEYQVKAAFLFQFTKFIEWPAEAFSDANAPVTICLVGDDPFGFGLDELVKGKLINGRGLQVVRLKPGPGLRSCQMLFISGSEKKRLMAILENVKAAPVVTVSESDSFIHSGGVINFLLINEQVRFDINLGATEGKGLKISSRLLSVARTVLRSQRGGG